MKRIEATFEDYAEIIGLGMLGVGFWVVKGSGWALIVVGGIVLAVALLGRLRGASRAEK